MKSEHHRYDISDLAWELLKDYLPRQKGKRGGQACDNRQFINAVIWILRTGAPWWDLPPDYGDWKNTHLRFCRWRCKYVKTFIPSILEIPLPRTSIFSTASISESLSVPSLLRSKLLLMY